MLRIPRVALVLVLSGVGVAAPATPVDRVVDCVGTGGCVGERIRRTGGYGYGPCVCDEVPCTTSCSTPGYKSISGPDQTCRPLPERCNGIDDDCQNGIDDGINCQPVSLEATSCSTTAIQNFWDMKKELFPDNSGYYAGTRSINKLYTSPMVQGVWVATNSDLHTSDHVSLFNNWNDPVWNLVPKGPHTTYVEFPEGGQKEGLTWFFLSDSPMLTVAGSVAFDTITTF